MEKAFSEENAFFYGYKGCGLFRELSGGLGAKAAQTRFPIADNFFTI